MSYFIVTGRLAFDDEDTLCYVNYVVACGPQEPRITRALDYTSPPPTVRK